MKNIETRTWRRFHENKPNCVASVYTIIKHCLYCIYDIFQNYQWIYGSPVNDFHSTLQINRENKFKRSLLHTDNTALATIRSKTLSINQIRELQQINYRESSHIINGTLKNTTKHSFERRRKRELKNNFPLSNWEKILIREKIIRDDEGSGDDTTDPTEANTHGELITGHNKNIYRTETEVTEQHTSPNETTDIQNTTQTTTTTTTTKPKPKKKRRPQLPKDEKPRYYISRPYILKILSGSRLNTLLSTLD